MEKAGNKSIAVCIATRGLINTWCIESVVKNLSHSKVHPHGFYFTKDKPIPDAQNHLVQQALADHYEYLWFVEEDMIIPDGALDAMLALEAPVVAVDYPMENGWGCVCHKDGKVLWCGLGCTLIRADVFDKISYPWFRSDKTARITDLEHLEFHIEDVPNKYGGHDIMFGLAVNEAGLEIKEVPGVTATHMKIQEYGKPGVNNGMHQYARYEKIEKVQNYTSRKAGE